MCSSYCDRQDHDEFQSSVGMPHLQRRPRLLMTKVQVNPIDRIQVETAQALAPLTRTTLRVMLEMGVVGLMTSGTTLFVVVTSGWANPFANRADVASIHAFTVWVVTSNSLFGALMMCVVVAFQLRGHQLLADPSRAALSIAKSAWIAVRESWRWVLGCAIVAGALTSLLFRVDAPLLEYNGQSLLQCFAVLIGASRMAANVGHFRRRRTTKLISPSPASPPVGTQPVSNSPLHTSGRRRHSWKRSLRFVLVTCLTPTLSVILMTQYMMIARTVQFGTIHGLFAFSIGSTLIKFALPFMSKRFVLKNRLRDPHTVFYVVAAPIFHVDIQLRMALLRAQRTVPVYLSSAILTAVEISARIVSVGAEVAVVRREKRRFQREKEALIAREVLRDDHEVREQVAKLEDKFMQWKQAHYRVCAAEILAEMAAEYCGIGLVTVFMIVLDDNVSIDLPHTPNYPGGGIASTQIKAWATQILFELLSDVVAVAIETRIGIPLVDTINNDKSGFMRWTAVVIASHSSGLCLSSLIALAPKRL